MGDANRRVPLPTLGFPCSVAPSATGPCASYVVLNCLRVCCATADGLHETQTAKVEGIASGIGNRYHCSAALAKALNDQLHERHDTCKGDTHALVPLTNIFSLQENTSYLAYVPSRLLGRQQQLLSSDEYFAESIPAQSIQMTGALKRHDRQSCAHMT